MLKVHVTLHHSQNDNKVLDSHSSTSNALDQEAYSSSTLQQKSNPNTDNSEIISGRVVLAINLTLPLLAEIH
jgi:hypothetical protein